MNAESRPFTKFNLSRWLESGEPYRWIWTRSGAWSEQDYAQLLAELKTGPYWPLDEAEVRQTLETVTSTFRDLERWGLLAKQDADDDIFF